VPFLHCAKGVVIGVLERHPSVASEDKAGGKTYVWNAKRYSVML
jgi:hypothetical protein